MQQLLDLQQIRDLKAKYCYYVDEYFEDPTNFDRLMREVFTDDTELDFGEVGGAKGRAEVENFFRNVVFSTLTFSQHLVHSPLITFKGADEAEGKWHFFVPCTYKAGNTAVWLSGTYFERYVKRGGNWYIRHLRAKFFFATPFAQGWTKMQTITLPE